MTAPVEAPRRELSMVRVFKHAWIYVIGLIASVSLILVVFFHLNPSTEIPPP